MYDKKDHSMGAKLYLAIFIFIAALIPSWLMFAETKDIIVWLRPYKIHANLARQIILSSCLGFYFLRILVTMFVFVRRKVSWIEAIIVSPCYILMFYWFAYSISDKSQMFGTVVIIGILLYLHTQNITVIYGRSRKRIKITFIPKVYSDTQCT